MRATTIAIAFVIAALCLVASWRSASAEDCTQQPAQSDQIACLQRTVEALKQEIAQLSTRQSLPRRTPRTYEEMITGRNPNLTLEDLIEQKIAEALRPRLQPMQ